MVYSRFLRVASCLVLSSLTLSIHQLSATEQLSETKQSFPYEAVVVAEQVEVRCGPGSRFYVTSYVNQQDKVTVQRHDHGGWFMIAPPNGSISWIDKAHVEKTSDSKGVVKVLSHDGQPARAIVRIGSTVSDEHSYYGRELSNGDEVRILGEEQLSTPRGLVEMYKIVPPSQEFRWIKGEFIVPINQQVQQAQATDPYLIPPQHRESIAKKDAIQKETSEIAHAESSRRSLQFQHLDEIDKAYAAMMKTDPKQWDLDNVASQYESLKTTSDSTVKAVIDQRLEIIGRRREILGHYKSFVQLANQTSKRDAQLVAQQTNYEVTAATTEWSSPSHQVETEQQPSVGGEAVMPRVNGAGIVRAINRAGGPAFAITSPDGRFLAYLELAKPISMQEWIGKEAGIIGKRSFDPNLRADLIRVQKIVAVELIP